MLYRRFGNLRLAREHLAAASALYADMGVPFWLERVAELTVGLGA